MSGIHNKLFVGNLPENCDPVKLKQVFSTHIRVTHCDIVKNFAFVHVVEEDMHLIEDIIHKLNGYVFEGKMLNLKKSTSKMRGSLPGQEGKIHCFRCGDIGHRTTNCPENEPTVVTDVLRVDLTAKRAGSKDGGPKAKKACEIDGQIDPELSRPIDFELLPLFNQYIDARNKYIFCKERLIQEETKRNRVVTYVTGAIVHSSGLQTVLPNEPTAVVSVPPAAPAAAPYAQPVSVPTLAPDATVHPAPPTAPYTIVQSAQGQRVVYPGAQQVSAPTYAYTSTAPPHQPTIYSNGAPAAVTVQATFAAPSSVASGVPAPSYILQQTPAPTAVPAPSGPYAMLPSQMYTAPPTVSQQAPTAYSYQAPAPVSAAPTVVASAPYAVASAPSQPLPVLKAPYQTMTSAAWLQGTVKTDRP